MKRIFNLAFACMAGAFLFSSCSDDTDLTTFDPAQVATQTLGNISGCSLDADGELLTLTYNEANFGVSAPVGYSLSIAADQNFTEPRKLAATIADGKISFKQKDLNSAILAMGGAADTEFTVFFRLSSSLLNDKNAEIGAQGAKVESNVVSATFIPYDVEVLDVDTYDHVWIIGSGTTVGAWSHDAVYQYLYDYNKDGNTYTGMIYYGADAASGWKLTGIAGWDDACNWGSEAQAEDAEPTSVQLVTGGGSKDIKCYSKQFYQWSFNKSSMVLTKEFGFDHMAIVGGFNDWNAADDACVMNYNDYYHRFYLDYNFTEDTELKFTADGLWDLNFGADMKQGGDNIAVKAGKYRIYLDFNKNEYEFNTAKYGTEEPGAPTKEPDPVWSLIGAIGGSNWDQDFYMSETESGVWTIKNFVITETDEFKLRFAQNWGQSIGGPEENAISKIDETNPYGVFLPEIGKPFATGDKNIMIGEAGKYDITYNTNDGTILIEAGATGWSLIGVNGDWNTDITMRELSSGVWASEAPVEIEGSFKLRYNCDWDINRGGTFSEVGQPFTAIPGGDNIEVPAGKYFVIYNPALETITINNDDWSAIGAVDGSAWDWDLYLAKQADGTYTSETFKVGADGFKLRQNGGWDVNVGGTLTALGTPFDVVADGSNIKVADDAVDQYYVAVYDPSANQMTVNKAWCIIGEVNGTSWTQDFPMTCVAPGVWSSSVVVNGGFKVRLSGDWGVNFGGTFGELGSAFEAVDGGDNITLTEFNKEYLVTLDTINKTLIVSAK